MHILCCRQPDISTALPENFHSVTPTFSAALTIIVTHARVDDSQIGNHVPRCISMLAQAAAKSKFFPQRFFASEELTSARHARERSRDGDGRHCGRFGAQDRWAERSGRPLILIEEFEFAFRPAAFRSDC